MNYLFYLYCVIIVVMRILKLFSAAFLLSLFFPCSNPAQVSSVRTAETLRTVSDSMAQNVVWSEELQGDFLKQKVIGADGVSKSVKTTPYSAAVSSDRQKYPPLPPYIRGFASLDTSLYDTQALETLNAFCSALVSGEGADSFMAEGDVYSLVMFRYDLARLFEEETVFSRYVIGKPFVQDGIYQCPVRFFTSQEESVSYLAPHTDVYIFLKKSEASWEVDQISFMDTSNSR